ncbi:MAG: MoaD family protein [Thermodesulfobacteriota bacterium]|nr:MoaD family protein [Thermodesulfobacteriota bacterium]
MSVIIKVPGSFSHLIGGNKEIACEANDIAGCIDTLELQFPGVKKQFCDEEGNLVDLVSIFVNGENIRFINNLATSLKPGDEVSIMPTLAGG